jgi:tRNA pseudouridine13 synthase
MASARPHDDTPLESPAKRQRLSSPTLSTPSSSVATTQSIPPVGKSVAGMDEPQVKMSFTETGFEPEREKQCAIIHFVNSSNPGFTGVLKQRYVLVFYYFF